MDFLLECIGFPPGTDLAALERTVAERGEPVAWRGPAGVHRRLPLAAGLELRLDRESGEDRGKLWPHFQSTWRLRVACARIEPGPDSPFDALLLGEANPPLPHEVHAGDDPYPFACYLTDARRVPRKLEPGHVLAVTAAGFALDVEDVREWSTPLDGRQGLFIKIADDPDAPGGCLELALPVAALRHLENPLTGEPVELVELVAPGKPLQVFLSRWQLAEERLPLPRPGWRVSGTFLFAGRIFGGLPQRAAGASGAFG
jgi:hypothetical protein